MWRVRPPPQRPCILIEKLRRAPAGGRGKGAALRTTASAAWSKAAVPELRAIDAYHARDPLVAWSRSLGVTSMHIAWPWRHTISHPLA